MKRKLYSFFAATAILWPTVALANSVPKPGDPGPGCWFLSADLNNLAGVALVGISVGIVLYSQRR